MIEIIQRWYSRNYLCMLFEVEHLLAHSCWMFQQQHPKNRTQGVATICFVSADNTSALHNWKRWLAIIVAHYESGVDKNNQTCGSPLMKHNRMKEQIIQHYRLQWSRSKCSIVPLTYYACCWQQRRGAKVGLTPNPLRNRANNEQAITCFCKFYTITWVTVMQNHTSVFINLLENIHKENRAESDS